jgi:hypothetical protein
MNDERWRRVTTPQRGDDERIDMSEQMTVQYFTGRVDRVKAAVQKAVDEAGAYGSDQLVADFEWIQYAHDHVHVTTRDEVDYVDDETTTRHLDELFERYRVG